MFCFLFLRELGHMRLKCAKAEFVVLEVLFAVNAD